jgi:Histidine kinase-, DNA gyrase B-, and HSP90-like ATPase
MSAAIREVIELTRSEAMKNGVMVQTDFGDDLPLVPGDRVELQQVILNLILNALEAMSATSEGSRKILITTGKTESDEVLVAVRDSGPGLDPVIRRIFSRPSTRPSRTAWDSGCRSVAPSSKGTADDCGRAPIRLGARSFNSRCPSLKTFQGPGNLRRRRFGQNGGHSSGSCCSIVATAATSAQCRALY